jgi:hypothetical protein
MHTFHLHSAVKRHVTFLASHVVQELGYTFQIHEEIMISSW